MALLGFLSIPGIEGESVVQEHEDEIEVWGVEWGIDGNVSSTARFSRRRSRADMGPLVVHKMWDQSSVYLAEATRRGKAFDEVVLKVHRNSGGSRLDYLVITMENVVIADYDMQHTDFEAEDERIRERVSFEFEAIKLTHTEAADDGSAGGEHEVELSDRVF